MRRETGPGNVSLDELFEQQRALEAKIAQLNQKKASVEDAISSQKSGMTQASFLDALEIQIEEPKKKRRSQLSKESPLPNDQLKLPELKIVRVHKNNGIVVPSLYFTEEELKSFDPWKNDDQWKNIVDQALAYYVFYGWYSSKTDTPVFLRYVKLIFGDLYKFDGRQLPVFLGCKSEQGVINKAKIACIQYRKPVEGKNEHLASLVSECQNNPDKYNFLSPRKFPINLAFRIRY